MFRPLPLIIFIRQFSKLPNNLLEVLITDISGFMPCLFVFVWTYFGLETQGGNQPLSWYFQFLFWLWRCDFHLLQAIKFQQNVQGDILVTTLDLSVFTNIVTTTIFHVHSWELFFTYERFLPERLPSGATMINRRWCYNC